MKVSGFTSGRGVALLPRTVGARDGDPVCVLIKAIHLGSKPPFLAPGYAQPTHPCSPFCFTTLFIMCVWAPSDAKNNTDDNVVDDNNKKGGEEQEHSVGRVPPEPESSLS